MSQNLFSCQETPLRFPENLKVKDLRTCKKCAVKLSTPVAMGGTGNLKVVAEGLSMDENVQSQLMYNGISYTLNDTRLTIPASHIVPGIQKAVAELHCYFQNIQTTYCLVLPLIVGKGVGNAYFSLLGELTRDRPVLQTLFSPDAAYIQYLGADIRGRSKTEPAPRGLCDPVATRVNYLVSTVPAHILATDLMRFQDRLKSSDYKGGPPISDKVLDGLRAKNMIMVVPNIRLIGAAAAAKPPSGVPNTPMQCRRLDMSRDVKDGKVYVGGAKRPGDTTLEQELEDAADPSKSLTGVTATATVQPGDIETILAIVCGIAVAVIVLGFLASGVLKKLPNYIPALKTYFADPTKSVLTSVKEVFERPS